MLQALPRRSWNMIYQRALVLGEHRAVYAQDDIPNTICVEDLNVIPNPDLAMELVLKASARLERSGKRNPKQGSSQTKAYPVWLNSADTSDLAQEPVHRNMRQGS